MHGVPRASALNNEARRTESMTAHTLAWLGQPRVVGIRTSATNMCVALSACGVSARVRGRAWMIMHGMLDDHVRYKYGVLDVYSVLFSLDCFINI